MNQNRDRLIVTNVCVKCEVCVAKIRKNTNEVKTPKTNKNHFCLLFHFFQRKRETRFVCIFVCAQSDNCMWFIFARELL